MLYTPPTNPIVDFGTPPKLMLAEPKSECKAPASKFHRNCASSGPSSDCESIDFENLWEDARLGEEEYKLSGSIDNESEYSSTDDEDEYCTGPSMRSIMVTLPCGDIHLCGGGFRCPFLEPNDDRIMVCRYTGVEYGPEKTEEFFDLNGGTGKRSGDPDQLCGEPMYRKYQKRADPVAVSRAAYQASWTISDTDIAIYMPSDAASKRAQKVPLKRNALCVGEHVNRNTDKRARVSKRNVNNHEMCINLHAEAESVLSKLINYSSASSYKNKCSGDRVKRNTRLADKRMCDYAFVFSASIRKYMRVCIANGSLPSIDAINNLAIMAQSISKNAKDESAPESIDALRTATFRRSFTSIVVSLWSAACQTPYIKEAKRGNDAYRPFICGVIYATKRGVSLQDGSVIVPKCPQLAAALPALRGTGGNHIAKTLHSSSHRGLCTLSRCIASVPLEQQRAAFNDVIRLSKSFSSKIFTTKDI
jgi:hypothetical protein